MDAFTMSLNPSFSAKLEIISSGAFPSEALINPPMVAPTYVESCSVASPINPASGTIARAEAQKIAIGLAPYQSNPSATGMNTSSRFRLIIPPFLCDACASSEGNVPAGRLFEKEPRLLVAEYRLQVVFLRVRVGTACVFQIDNAELIPKV